MRQPRNGTWGALSRSSLVLPLIVGLVALAVYLRTLLPGPAFGDWGEMQTVPHVLGVAHPTGYPTYIILGWLAQLVPVGSIAFRANLLSAILVACALGVTVAILLRLGTRPVIAGGAALLLGAVGTVWAAATVAEVNPLHLLFVALLLHRALVWEEDRRPRDLIIGAALLGLAVGNHLLILFVAPFLVLFVLWVGRKEIAANPRILVGAVAAGLISASVYLYIPIAAAGDPPLPYNDPVTLEAVLWLVSGAQFRGQFAFLSASGLSEFVGSLPALWQVLADRGTPLLPIVGGVGLALLIRQRPAFGLMCAAILTINLYIWATYLRLEHYLLVPWLILVLGTGVALEAAARSLDARASPSLSRVGIGRLVGAATLALAVGLTAANWTAADRSADRSADTFVNTVLAELPPDAVILSEWDSSTPLWHARYVQDRRPDILIVDDTNIVYEGWGSRENRIASLICERPVFILRLTDADLVPTQAAYRLEPFTTVMVALGGPSASVSRPIYRVQPLDPAGCSAMAGARWRPRIELGRDPKRRVFIDVPTMSSVYGREGVRPFVHGGATHSAGPGGDEMDTDGRNGHGAGSAKGAGARFPGSAFDSHRIINLEQASADAEQSLADSDQTRSDLDQAAAAADAASAMTDQIAADRDQAAADRAHEGDHRTGGDDTAYDRSRSEREAATVERIGTQLRRGHTAGERDLTAAQRDRIAEARDKAGRDRDARAAELARAVAEPHASLEQQLELVRAQAAADRARAAADRERAALDRANAAHERGRLEAELRSAHLDELTGAYRREMGQMTLSHEIDRARRSDGRFVVAFVDVDELKLVNDRDGHATGDRVLQIVVHEIRSRLRSFDPIVRYGGDEFVCGLSGTDLAEAARRFDTIADAIRVDAGVGISVGMAALIADETADQLTERADAAMLKVKARHHTRA